MTTTEEAQSGDWAYERAKDIRLKWMQSALMNGGEMALPAGHLTDIAEALREAATPAPSSPGVPDSVRALSEARNLLANLLPGLSPEEHAKSFRSAASRATAEGATKRGNRLLDKAEAIECALALISTHPAGQSTGQGAIERSVEHAPQGGATTSARHNKPRPRQHPHGAGGDGLGSSPDRAD